MHIPPLFLFYFKENFFSGGASIRKAGFTTCYLFCFKKGNRFFLKEIKKFHWKERATALRLSAQGEHANKQGRFSNNNKKDKNDLCIVEFCWVNCWLNSKPEYSTFSLQKQKRKRHLDNHPSFLRNAKIKPDSSAFFFSPRMSWCFLSLFLSL